MAPKPLTPNEQEDVRKRATDAVQRALLMDDDVADTFKLSSGVVLKFRTISPMLLKRAVRSVPIPEIPKFMHPSKDRMEPNPSDPDYQRDLILAHSARLEALLKLFYALCVDVESKPDGFPGPDDPEWLEELSYAGIADLHPDDPKLRQIEWLELYATKSEWDYQVLFFNCLRRFGLMESEVMASFQFFLDRAPRPTDTGRDGTEPANGDRNPVTPTGSPGPGVRGTRSRPIRK